MKITINYCTLKVELPLYETEKSIYLSSVFQSNELRGGVTIDTENDTEIIYGTGTNDSIVSVLTVLQDESFDGYYSIDSRV